MSISPDASYQLEVKPGADYSPELVDEVRQQIEEHCARQGYGPSDRIVLRVWIEPPKYHRNSLEAALSVKGSVGDHPLVKTFGHSEKRAQNSRNAPPHIISILAGSAVAGIAVLVAMTKFQMEPHAATVMWMPLAAIVERLVTSSMFTPDDSESGEKLAAGRRECVKLLCLDIDELLVGLDPSRGENDAASLFKGIGYVRWAVALGVTIPLLIYMLQWRDPKTPLGAIVGMGVVMGLALFGFVHVLRLAAMPARFLQNDPRGQRAMKRFGVKSVLGMRAAAIAAAAMLGLIAGFIGLMFFFEIQERIKAEAKQKTQQNALQNLQAE